MPRPRGARGEGELRRPHRPGGQGPARRALGALDLHAQGDALYRLLDSVPGRPAVPGGAVSARRSRAGGRRRNIRGAVGHASQGAGAADQRQPCRGHHRPVPQARARAGALCAGDARPRRHPVSGQDGNPHPGNHARGGGPPDGARPRRGLRGEDGRLPARLAGQQRHLPGAAGTLSGAERARAAGKDSLFLRAEVERGPLCGLHLRRRRAGAPGRPGGAGGETGGLPRGAARAAGRPCRRPRPRGRPAAQGPRAGLAVPRGPDPAGRGGDAGLLSARGRAAEAPLRRQPGGGCRACGAGRLPGGGTLPGHDRRDERGGHRKGRADPFHLWARLARAEEAARPGAAAAGPLRGHDRRRRERPAGAAAGGLQHRHGHGQRCRAAGGAGRAAGLELRRPAGRAAPGPPRGQQHHAGRRHLPGQDRLLGAAVGRLHPVQSPVSAGSHPGHVDGPRHRGIPLVPAVLCPGRAEDLRPVSAQRAAAGAAQRRRDPGLLPGEPRAAAGAPDPPGADADAVLPAGGRGRDAGGLQGLLAPQQPARPALRRDGGGILRGGRPAARRAAHRAARRAGRAAAAQPGAAELPRGARIHGSAAPGRRAAKKETCRP